MISMRKSKQAYNITDCEWQWKCVSLRPNGRHVFQIFKCSKNAKVTYPANDESTAMHRTHLFRIDQTQINTLNITTDLNRFQ